VVVLAVAGAASAVQGEDSLDAVELFFGNEWFVAAGELLAVVPLHPDLRGEHACREDDVELVVGAVAVAVAVVVAGATASTPRRRGAARTSAGEGAMAIAGAPGSGRCS
jgi:uncharacterized membrane protein